MLLRVFPFVKCLLLRLELRGFQNHCSVSNTHVHLYVRLLVECVMLVQAEFDFTIFIALINLAMLITNMSNKQAHTIPNTVSTIQPRIGGCLELLPQETHTHMHDIVFSEKPFLSKLISLLNSFTRRECNTLQVDMHTFESGMRLCYIIEKTIHFQCYLNLFFALGPLSNQLS